MSERKINEEFLLLLVEKDGLVETTTISIDNHFEDNSLILNELCAGNGDNILQIAEYINSAIKPKLPPNITYNYCKELGAPFQSVHVNIDKGVKDMLDCRGLIYLSEKVAKRDNDEYDLEEKFRRLKCQIKEKVELWFKAFNIDLAYKKAKKVPGMLLYSHRISGWSNPEYKITSALKQEVKTNFGYGRSSYFYSLLTFKNIQITPLSEWIDYRYANSSEVIRYTRRFGGRIAKYFIDGKGNIVKTRIDNSYWCNAIEFTKDAANLSLINEKEFVDKYIMSECEKMIIGLEGFYDKNEFIFLDEDQVSLESKDCARYRVGMNGYELIDFRTEKIIGALDFIHKIIEYNSIIPTNEYAKRIVSINQSFIPNVHHGLEAQKEELITAQNNFKAFLVPHNELVKKQLFYQEERLRLKDEFDAKYRKEYEAFKLKMNISNKEHAWHINKINLHAGNVESLSGYIKKYNDFMKQWRSQVPVG